MWWPKRRKPSARSTCWSILPASAPTNLWRKRNAIPGRRLIKVNLLSYAYLIRESLEHLRASGRGSIINVASTHAVNPRAGMGQYDVTKAGIVSLTKTLAFEEAKHRIRVNAVCPGGTLTPFHLRRAKAAGRTQEDLERDGTQMCLLGRWADAREVAYPLLWLASDEASYVTGSVLMVDGGQFTK